MRSKFSFKKTYLLTFNIIIKTTEILKNLNYKLINKIYKGLSVSYSVLIKIFRFRVIEIND